LTDTQFDVAGIGNAIVDILAQAEEDFLRREGIRKGVMTLVDADRAKKLYEKMGPATTVSGGSAANTIAGLANLGGKCAFIGKVHDDQMGAVFQHDMKALKVHFRAPPSTQGAPTACCIILVTPDGQRSMNTYLGASTDLSEEDIDENVIAASKVTYLEGYLFDKEPAMKAFHAAAYIAHKNGRKVALTLSDPFCVDRHRDDFKALLNKGVDILFANESEILALYQVNKFDDVVVQLGKDCPLAIVTRSELGSIIIEGPDTTKIPVEKVETVVDSTGAGDLYAAGFLYGYTQSMPLPHCGRMAAICAAEVITHMGPRPQTSLKRLVQKKAGLLVDQK
jgi:sugar/nucleoside kinase (ribokinase family)